MRLLCRLVAVGLLFGVVTASAGARQESRAAAPMRVDVRIPLPAAGQITLARSVLRARPGTTVPRRVVAQVLDVKGLPGSVVVVGGVLRLDSRTFVVLVGMVSKPAAQKLASPDAPAGRATRGQETAALDLAFYTLSRSKVAGRPAARRYLDGKSWSTKSAYASVAPGEEPTASLAELFAGSSSLDRAIGDPRLEVFSLPGNKLGTLPLLELEVTAGKASNDGDEARLEGIVAEIRAAISPEPSPPASPAPGQLYRFSFAGFGLSFDGPHVHVDFRVPGGTACGADLAAADWSVPYAVTAGGTSTGSVTANFAQANPFLIYRFIDFLGPNGSLIADLRLVPGTSPELNVEVATAGAVSNVALTPDPPQLPIVKTPVESC